MRPAHRRQRIVARESARDGSVHVALVHLLVREDIDQGPPNVLEPIAEVCRGELIQAVCQIAKLVHARDEHAMFASQGRDHFDR